MKKNYSAPQIEVYPVKHNDIVTGSGLGSYEIMGGSGDAPGPSDDGFIWGE